MGICFGKSKTRNENQDKDSIQSENHESNPEEKIQEIAISKNDNKIIETRNQSKKDKMKKLSIFSDKESSKNENIDKNEGTIIKDSIQENNETPGNDEKTNELDDGEKILTNEGDTQINDIKNIIKSNGGTNMEKIEKEKGKEKKGCRSEGR